MSKTAKEAGWHISRYNLYAPVPDTGMTAIVNLYKGTCVAYSPLELYLLSALDELDENHPIIPCFADRGLIADFDELAAVEAYGRAACAYPLKVSMIICPTMACNFDCPYCYEKHGNSRMSMEVAEDVTALAARMLEASGAPLLEITWYGGEPLLAPEIIDFLSEQLVKTAKEHRAQYRAEIITNGYLLTQELADLLEKAQVKAAQVTLDGIGDAHDATRHLAGGGATYGRIVSNLSDLHLPFRVNIRHNVHVDNYEECRKLRGLVRELAQKSGNDLHYYPSAVHDSDAGRQRGDNTKRLCGQESEMIGILRDAGRLHRGRGHFCGACSIWNVVLDDQGRLYKCWTDVTDPSLSFGEASSWNPKDPMESASRMDRLTAFLNTSLPNSDPVCRECVWLPACAGNCPHNRLDGIRSCLPYKDSPDQFVLEVYRRREKEKEENRGRTERTDS